MELTEREHDVAFAASFVRRTNSLSVTATNIQARINNGGSVDALTMASVEDQIIAMGEEVMKYREARFPAPTRQQRRAAERAGSSRRKKS